MDVNEITKSYPHSEITEKIIKVFYEVYNELGYGFLEKVYERAMFYALQDAGFNTVSQYPLSVNFREYNVGDYYADLIVENKIIIELKAVEKIIRDHEVQLVNYLKATNIEVGLLLNFGPKPQIKRKIFSVNNQRRSK